MTCYGVYINGKLKKSFKNLKKANKYASNKVKDISSKSIRISQLKKEFKCK